MQKRIERLQLTSEPGEWVDIWLNPPDSYRKLLYRGAQNKPKEGEDETYFEAVTRAGEETWVNVLFPCVENWSFTGWGTDAPMPRARESLDLLPLAVLNEIASRIGDILCHRKVALGEVNGGSSSPTSVNGQAPQSVEI